MIRKVASGKFRLYSRKKNADTGKRRNLGTFATRAAAQKHERDVQYFKHLDRRAFGALSRRLAIVVGADSFTSAGSNGNTGHTICISSTVV